MGELTQQLEALGRERATAAPTAATEIGAQAIRSLKARGMGEGYSRSRHLRSGFFTAEPGRLNRPLGATSARRRLGLHLLQRLVVPLLQSSASRSTDGAA